MASPTLIQSANLAKGHRGPRRPKPRSQVLRMQAAMLKAATDPNVQPHIRAQCVRAWDVLQERLRILDGKPLPGNLRPELEQRQRKSRSQLIALPVESSQANLAQSAHKESLNPTLPSPHPTAPEALK